MISPKGGVSEAAKLLAGLPLDNRKKVIELIRTKDPSMAEDLLKHLVTLEDLKYVTVGMMVDLLKEMRPPEFALALRMGSDELKQHIKSCVTKRVWEEMSEVIYGPPRVKTDVMRAHDKLMEIVLCKAETGELVLSKSGSEEMV